MSKLIGSAGSLESLLKLTKEYFFSQSIEFNQDGSISNSKGVIQGVVWELKRGRYRLVRV